MSNSLDYLKEMTGKWHIRERWIEVDGESYKFTQDRDTMIVTDHMGAAVCPCECAGAQDNGFSCMQDNHTKMRKDLREMKINVTAV